MNLLSVTTEVKKSKSELPNQFCQHDGEQGRITIKKDGQSWCLSPEHCSSWKRFTQVLAVVRKFVENCFRKKESGELKPTEPDADVEAIRNAQLEAFYEEYVALQCLEELPKNSKVLALRRQSDEEGLIRYDG